MAVAPDVGSKLIAWLMAGTGTLLAYSAFRNRSPWDVLRDIEGEPLAARTPTGSFGESFGNVGSIPRLRMIANREMKPDLVPIKPFGKLDRDAAASKERIDAKLGYVVPHVGAHRTFATQAVKNANDPGRFASPGGSMHVVGLAIDIHNAYKDKPEVIQAFTEEGWHRYDPTGESHHWSYGVRG